MKAKLKIIDSLKSNGRSSTWKIAEIVRIDYNYAIKLLEDLHAKGYVMKEEETRATYWTLKKGIKRGDIEDEE